MVFNQLFGIGIAFLLRSTGAAITIKLFAALSGFIFP